MHVLIEIAISMVGLYIIFSIVNSALVEAYAQYVNKRGNFLRKSLDNFFQDPAKESINLADELYNHKLIEAFKKKKGENPSYIDANIFTQAFMELVFENTHEKDKEFKGNIKEGVSDKLPGDLEKTLNFIINKATEKSGVNMDKVQKEIEGLYSSYMGRVGEWYKQKMKLILGVSGLILALSLNLDSVNFFNALKNDGELRREQVAISKQLYENQAAIESKAQSLKDSINVSGLNPADLKANVDELLTQILDKESAKTLDDNFSEFGIGLHKFFKKGKTPLQYFWSILGIGLTGLALSFGSSFWFSLLKKLLGQ